jgi:hypothetical protein
MSFENKSRKWLSWKTLRNDAKAAVGILCKARGKANGSLDDYFREELYLGSLASGVAGPETCLSGFLGKGDFFATSSALGEGSDFSRFKALMFATARAV